MKVQVPAEAYTAFARGEISESELLDLEKLASDLNKQAGISITPGTAAGLAGLTVAAPMLAYAGAQIPQTIEGGLQAITFNRDLRRVVQVNPQLGNPSDPNLRMAFKTLRTTNPEYAADPLIAGTILDMVMTNRMNPDDPTSAPRFDPALLQSIQGRKTTARDVATAEGAKASVGPVAKSLLEG
jgi:hypothetical protein